MQKKGFSLRELFTVLAVIAMLALLLAPAVVHAMDKGPQHVATVVSTNSNPSVINLPVGDIGAFIPQWLLISGPFSITTQVGTNAPTITALTQTVSFVDAAGAYTGTVATVTAPGMIALTNLPPLFQGDSFLITTTGLGTNTLTVTPIGRVWQ